VDDLCRTAPKLCAHGERLGIPAATRARGNALTGKNTIHTLCKRRKL
jgi:hypothetical protein